MALPQVVTTASSLVCYVLDFAHASHIHVHVIVVILLQPVHIISLSMALPQLAQLPVDAEHFSVIPHLGHFTVTSPHFIIFPHSLHLAIMSRQFMAMSHPLHLACSPLQAIIVHFLLPPSRQPV